MANPRRRRRRRYRRHNPSPYAMPNPRRRSRGGRRRNPGGNLLDFDRAIEVAPPATLGVLIARWLTKFAGPFEGTVGGVPAQPGIKHALALLVGSKIGADIIDGFMPGKGHIAEIAALGFGGDLFLRKRFMRDSRWMQENLYLEGFDMDSQIGADTFVDATGQTYVRTANGWALAGFDMHSQIGQYQPGQIFTLPDGTVVQVEGEYESGDYAMGSQYESGSNAMGFGDSSFGYG
jgi:hypothetical protein